VRGQAARRIAAVAFALGVPLVAGAQTNLIANGDFDVFVDSNSTGSGGWGSNYIDQAGGWRDTGGNPGAHFILNNLEPSGIAVPFINQSVSVVPGGIYTLSADFTSAIVNDEPPEDDDSFEVFVNGEIVFASGPTSIYDWQTLKVDVVSDSPTLELIFRAQRNASNNDFAIDNVALMERCPDSPAADLNCDGIVDGADLGILLGSWGPCEGGVTPCAADLNGTGDGVVDGSDLGALLGAWGAVRIE
jgi:hypothetical protein